jgi:hypothetical protein
MSLRRLPAVLCGVLLLESAATAGQIVGSSAASFANGGAKLSSESTVGTSRASNGNSSGGSNSSDSSNNSSDSSNNSSDSSNDSSQSSQNSDQSSNDSSASSRKPQRRRYRRLVIPWQAKQEAAGLLASGMQTPPSALLSSVLHELASRQEPARGTRPPSMRDLLTDVARSGPVHDAPPPAPAGTATNSPAVTPASSTP